MKKLVVLFLSLALVAGLLPMSLAAELPYVEMDWYVGQTPQLDQQTVNDKLNEYLMEKLNMKINMKFMTTADWESKMGTMISSGQDLGIIGFGSQSKSDYVVESQRGSFYPITELLDKVAPETKALFPAEIWEAMKINGEIYGIPSLKDNGYFISLIYNADMAEKYGIDIDAYEYRNFRDLEPLFRDAKAKRDADMPEWADRPIVWGVDRLYPYNFAFETFLNDSFLAVCNIDGIMDLAGYTSDQAVNFYDTQEFLDFSLQKQAMVDEGLYAYDYTNLTDWQYDGSIFAFVGWGYTFMQEHLYSDQFVTKMRMSDHLWTETNNYFSAGTAISAKCSDPERALMFLNLVNTDPYVATMMRFGVEGVHYVLDENGKMTFEGTINEDPSNRAYYYWYGAPMGNLTIVNAPEELTGPDGIMLTKMMEYNDSCIKPKHLGFVFDTSPVVNEIAACTNIVLEYQPGLSQGQASSPEEVEELVQEFRDKLKANGAEKIVAEVQKQLDAWMASK